METFAPATVPPLYAPSGASGALLCRIGLHSWRLLDEREFSMGFNVVAVQNKKCRRCPAMDAHAREVSAPETVAPETSFLPDV